MVDPRFAIWDVLHDGTITVVAREEPDAVIMFVSIPFVRRRIPPLGDSFRLRLGGFRSVSFSYGYGDSDVKDLERSGFLGKLRAINPSFSPEAGRSHSELTDAEGQELLEVASSSMPVNIRTALGTLLIDFDSLDIALDSGHPISYEEVRRAAQDYWDELAARTRPVQ
jgi:hypothetical protein